MIRGRRTEYLTHKEKARAFIVERLEYFNQFYGYTYGRVSVKNTKTRWGSCSKKGNLNFTYRLVLIDAHLADYVVLHELCHIGEFNHGAGFWKLIEKQMPDWKARRDALKRVRF